MVWIKTDGKGCSFHSQCWDKREFVPHGYHGPIAETEVEVADDDGGRVIAG